MSKVKLRVERLAHCKALPEYATGGAAGMDLCFAAEEPLVLEAGERPAHRIARGRAQADEERAEVLVGGVGEGR